MDFWARRPLRTNLIGMFLLALVWLGLARLVISVGYAYGLSVIWLNPLIYLILLAATVLVTRFYDAMPLAWAGIGFNRWTLREIALGVALGAGMALVAWAPGALIGGVRAGDGWNRIDVLYYLVPMMCVAAGEELLFRGYLFQRGVEIMGPVTATIVASGLFAAAHLANPNVTAIGIAIIFLGGIFFSLCYLRTGSLWAPIGAHAAWNILLGKVLGAPVSGQDFGGSFLHTAVAGPAFLTGGAFGPEGGLVAAVALGAGIWALLALPGISYSPYTYAAVFRALYEKRKGKRE